MDEPKAVLHLDGSYGMGHMARVTLTTADKTNGKINTVYEFPYQLIKTELLNAAVETGYLLGFAIEKIIPPNAKTVVLSIGEHGLRADLEGGE